MKECFPIKLAVLKVPKGKILGVLISKPFDSNNSPNLSLLRTTLTLKPKIIVRLSDLIFLILFAVVILQTLMSMDSYDLPEA